MIRMQGRKCRRAVVGVSRRSISPATGAPARIAKLDRLSRNAAFLLTLRNSGVRFLAADMPEANDLTVGIMALVAQQEREAIARRTKEALQAAKARGTRLGNPNGGPRAVTDNADRFAEALSPVLADVRTCSGNEPTRRHCGVEPARDQDAARRTLACVEREEPRQPNRRRASTLSRENWRLRRAERRPRSATSSSTDPDELDRPAGRITDTGYLDMSTVGASGATSSIPFKKQKQYWVGIRHSSTAVISAWPAYTSPDLDLTAIATSPNKTPQRTLAYVTAAPVSWGYVAIEAASTLAAAL